MVVEPGAQAVRRLLNGLGRTVNMVVVAEATLLLLHRGGKEEILYLEPVVVVAEALIIVATMEKLVADGVRMQLTAVVVEPKVKMMERTAPLVVITHLAAEMEEEVVLEAAVRTAVTAVLEVYQAAEAAVLGEATELADWVEVANAGYGRSR